MSFTRAWACLDVGGTGLWAKALAAKVRSMANMHLL